MKAKQKAEGNQARGVVKERGQLVTVETPNGMHVATMRRATALKAGLIESKRGKNAPRKLASDAFAHLGRMSERDIEAVQQVCDERLSHGNQTNQRGVK